MIESRANNIPMTKGIMYVLILPSVRARWAYPRRFLGRVGRTPLSPTLIWRRFQMPSRKGVKNVCLGPTCTSERLAGNEIELGMMIPTIESQASNIPMTKGTPYVVVRFDR